MRRIKKERKQRIAEMEAKLQSTRETITAALRSSWDEIEMLKEQNITLKTQITDLESALNVRYLILNQSLEQSSKTGAPIDPHLSYQDSGNLLDGSCKATSAPMLSKKIDQVGKDEVSRMDKRHTIPKYRDECGKVNTTLHNSKENIAGMRPEMKHKFASFQQLRLPRTDKSISSCPATLQRLSEHSKIPIFVRASCAANQLSKKREKKSTSQHEQDLRRVLNSMDATCALTLQDLQSKLQGTEAAILTLQKAKVIQEVTIASLDLELEDLEVNSLSMEECWSEIAMLKSQIDELDAAISKMHRILDAGTAERRSSIDHTGVAMDKANNDSYTNT